MCVTRNASGLNPVHPAGAAAGGDPAHPRGAGRLREAVPGDGGGPGGDPHRFHRRRRARDEFVCNLTVPLYYQTELVHRTFEHNLHVKILHFNVQSIIMCSHIYIYICYEFNCNLTVTSI